VLGASSSLGERLPPALQPDVVSASQGALPIIRRDRPAWRRIERTLKCLDTTTPYFRFALLVQVGITRRLQKVLCSAQRAK